MTRLEQILSDLVGEVRALGVRLDTMERTVAGCQQARATAAAVEQAERTAEVVRSERTWGRVVQVASSAPVRYAVMTLLIYLAVRLGLDPGIIPAGGSSP